MKVVPVETTRPNGLIYLTSTIGVAGTYTDSAWIKCTSGTQLSIAARESGGEGAGWTPISCTGVWQRVSTTYTLPAGTYSSVGFEIIDRPVGSAYPVNWGMSVDNVMITTGSSLINYFDGSYPNSSWTWIANVSTSIGYAN